MAKRKRKKPKKAYKRKSSKRSRAAKRAYRKSGLFKYNQSKKKGRGKRKKKYARKHGGRRKGHHKYSRRRTGLSPKGVVLVQSLVNKGYSRERAHKIVARMERMRAGRAGRHFAGEAAAASARQRMSNLWANIAQAGVAAKMSGN
jgi:hypothetical protein